MKIFALLLFGLSVASTSEVDLEEFVKSNNLFAADIFKEISKNEKGNILVSPFAVATALAFAQSGCEGETAEEIQNTLHLPNSKNITENAVKTLLSTMIRNDLYTLHTANKMYLKENYQIKETFKEVATKVYNAEIENINFTKKKEAAEKMNDWVANHANNKDHNLIDPNSLKKYNNAVLINALYFKAPWVDVFDFFHTRKQKFYKTSKDITEVDMMHNYLRTYNYYESSQLNAKFLELPFKGAEALMTIVLPNEIDGIKSLESKLDIVFAPQNFTKERLDIAIPKFKIKAKTDLKDILRNLGVNKVFDQEKADLSGVAGKKGELYIDDIVQKTFIHLDEDGIEAPKVTCIVPLPNFDNYNPYDDSIKEFIVDHPFIFYVKVKNVIILTGKIVLPQYSFDVIELIQKTIMCDKFFK